MKKRLAAFIAAALAVICLIGASACNKVTYSDTFNGVISEQSYSDENSAAQAFLENEVNGNTTRAAFVGYTKTGDLSEEELAALDLTEEVKSQIDYAEKGEVEYVEVSRARDVSSDLTQSKKQNVYIFKIGSSYRYFVPVQQTGEYITKSYFESVFDTEKYKNFTMTANSVSEGRGQDAYSSVDVKVELSYTYKVTESAIQLKISQKYYEFGELAADKEINNLTVYLIETETGLRAFVQQLIIYTEYPLSELGLGNIHSISDIFDSNLPSFIDQSYFAKTDSGFAIRDDRMDEFLDNYMDEIFEGVFNKYLGFKESMEMTADTSYFVTDGRLSKATAACSLNGTYQGATIYASASAECNYSDFGSTKVSIPAGIKSQL